MAKEEAGVRHNLRSKNSRVVGPGYCLRSFKAPATRIGNPNSKKKSRSIKVSKPRLKPMPKEDPEDAEVSKPPYKAKPKDDFIDIVARKDPKLAAQLASQSTRFAKLAIEYLEKEGSPYELVEPGRTFAASTSLGLICHFNFEAKRKHDPKAPVETFFGQLRRSGREWKDTVDCCVSLGCSDELPDCHSRDVYIGGCMFCSATGIHHPKGGCKRLLAGCDNDDLSWLDRSYDDHVDPDDYF